MILLFGLPGSGKTTQAQHLATSFGWTVIDAGVLLRQQSDPEIIRELQAGELVNPDKVNKLIDAALATTDPQKVVIDGFPRQKEQAEWLVARGQNNAQAIGAAIVLDVPNEAVARRLLARQRDDDTPEAIIERVNEQRASLAPVIDYFEGLGVPIIHIDGTQAEADVHAAIVRHLEELHLA